MSKKSVNNKLGKLKKATESFRATKKQQIARICSVGRKHKILKYPSLIAAILFILFVDIVFYLFLFVLLDKKRALGIALVLVALIGFLFVFRDYDKSDKLYEETQNTYTKVQEIDAGNTEKTDSFSVEAQRTKEKETSKTSVGNIKDEKKDEPEAEKEEVPKPLEWHELISVDFDGLKGKNEDIIGWLYFENVDISYPILQGRDNEEYLRTSYLKKSSRAGSIFLDCINTPDFSDYHSIIYGHNLTDKTMFGNLAAYREDKDFYKEHQYFQIITPEKKYRYEIVTFKQVKDDDPIYDLSILDEYEVNEYVQKFIINDSTLGIGLTAYERDHFVTLSTCSPGNKRFLVSAFRIAETDTE